MELIEKGANHSNAIFDLRKIGIVARRWQFRTGHDVNLVTQKSKRGTELSLEPPLHRRHLRDRLPGIVRRKRFKPRKITTMVGHPERHDGHRADVGIEPGEIGNRSL